MNSAADIRRLALSLPGVSEIDHFARPGFRTTKRIFAVIRTDGLWLNLPEERKEFLLEADPKAFVRYMWGKRVNVIVQPARVSKKELEALIREAWEFNQPPPPKTKKAKAANPPGKPSVERPAAPRRHRPRT